jgi:pilus assembly protein CpaF
MFGRRGTSTDTSPSTNALKSGIQDASFDFLDAVKKSINLNSETTTIEKNHANFENKYLTFRERDKERYYRLKQEILTSVIEVIDITILSNYELSRAKDEIRDVTTEIISLRGIQITLDEQEEIVTDLCSDFLGLGPLEPLMERDDINDIMVNGPHQVYAEYNGRMQLTTVEFRDQQQLMNICQRLVGQVGRRIDEASPICDARLLDGSRINVIAPPLALEGPVLTIRKFKKDRLTLDQLQKIGTVSKPLAELIQIIGRIRCNVLISGGTGSGKTTLLNCLTRYIDKTERVITCEDTAELQLQQPHVVRLETRPASLEGTGEITMRDLIKNCLRMRPERIIVGEVRGAEAMDLLQAMNTGHDGSMGTVHANNAREAIARIEALVNMNASNLPIRVIRDMIVSSVDVVIQVERLRDGSRRVMSVSEVLGLEGDTLVMQDLAIFKIIGEDDNGRINGQHIGTGIYRPRLWERARYFNEDARLENVMDALNAEAGQSKPRE